MSLQHILILHFHKSEVFLNHFHLLVPYKKQKNAFLLVQFDRTNNNLIKFKKINIYM